MKTFASLKEHGKEKQEGLFLTIIMSDKRKQVKGDGINNGERKSGGNSDSNEKYKNERYDK